LKVLHFICSYILNRYPLEQNKELAIRNYVREDKLGNDDEYSSLLFSLPSPLPGYSLADKNPILAQEWHKSLNGTLTPNNVSAHSAIKAWWVCIKGHNHAATVNDRSNGRGCPVCSHRRVAEADSIARIDSTLCSEWHFEKNVGVSPFDLAPYSKVKVWWRCEKGHEWQATVGNRYRGNTGCPVCWNERRKVRRLR
jgi:hypothetical protein